MPSRPRAAPSTAEDFEELARAAAPDAARVRCVAAGDGSDASAVRLLVVPKMAPDSMGRLPDEELRRPPVELLQRIETHLDACRLIGTRLVVAPPVYHGITVVAQLSAQPPAQPDDVRRTAVRALYEYLSPLTGGPERNGWPFGRPVQAFDISAVLAAVPGVATVDEVLIFPAELTTGQRGEPAPRVNVGKNALVMSYQHQVRVR